MPITSNQITGKRRSPITATITNAGVLVNHRGTRRPVAVICVALGTTATKYSYDRDNSTATQMKLYSDSAGGVSTLCYPIWGNE